MDFKDLEYHAWWPCTDYGVKEYFNEIFRSSDDSGLKLYRVNCWLFWKRNVVFWKIVPAKYPFHIMSPVQRRWHMIRPGCSVSMPSRKLSEVFSSIGTFDPEVRGALSTLYNRSVSYTWRSIFVNATLNYFE